MAKLLNLKGDFAVISKIMVEISSINRQLLGTQAQVSITN
jgi:hypothetical protein